MQDIKAYKLSWQFEVHCGGMNLATYQERHLNVSFEKDVGHCGSAHKFVCSNMWLNQNWATGKAK